LETTGASGQRILLEGGKSGGGKSDETNGTRSESSTPIGSTSQLVDDDGDHLRTKSIPQSRVYPDGINNKDEDYCTENGIPSGPSDNDSEEVAWSQRNSASSAPAANKVWKTTAVNRPTTTANSFLPLLLSNDRELQLLPLRMPYRLQVPLSPLLLTTGPRRSLLLLLEERRRHEESSREKVG
jgi:hypothetical protein